MPMRRTARPVAVVITLSAIALVVLLVLVLTRPRLPSSPAAWSGDELARAGCWFAACGYALWLLVTTLGCAVALARHRPASSTRATRWSPPIARQVLRAALAGTLAVAPPAPVTLHVGGDGHLVTGHEPRHTRPAATTAPIPRPMPAARVTPRTTPRVHVVRAGDNLWTISGSVVALATGRRPDDRAIVPYWRRVIAANRTTLRSGDPSLIFPGELITLPAY